MALVNITPVMTSSTTPSPYVVTGSSALDATKSAWYALDGSATTWWHSASGVAQWLKIDFGSSKKVDAISITSNATNTSAPKNFILYGSNDDITYEKILECNNEMFWTSGGETRLYKLPNSVAYRYYKLTTSADNGYGYIVINELKFWQDDSVIEYVTNANASRNYCLPKNSTNIMMNRQNDLREGLLGFANDPDDRYGTLYMIDDKGHAIIPMSRLVDADLLFDGVAGTASASYSLIKSFKKYKYLIMIGGFDSGTRSVNPIIIPTDMISITPTTPYKDFSISVISSTTCYYYITFVFDSETSIKILSLATAYWTNPAISKIYGIK